MIDSDRLKYQVTLWVSLEEEVAIIQLFQNKGWPYIKVKNDNDTGLFTSKRTIKFMSVPMVSVTSKATSTPTVTSTPLATSPAVSTSGTAATSLPLSASASTETSPATSTSASAATSSPVLTPVSIATSSLRTTLTPTVTLTPQVTSDSEAPAVSSTLPRSKTDQINTQDVAQTDHNSYTKPANMDSIASDISQHKEPREIDAEGMLQMSPKIETCFSENEGQEVCTTHLLGDGNTFCISSLEEEKYIEECERFVQEVNLVEVTCNQEEGSQLFDCGEDTSDTVISGKDKVVTEVKDVSVMTEELTSGETSPSTNDVASGLDVQYNLVVDFKFLKTTHSNKIPIPRKNEKLTRKQVRDMNRRKKEMEAHPIDKISLVISVEVDGVISSVCCMCMKGFDNSESFSAHADNCLRDLLNRDKGTLYKCKTCHAGFRNAASLLQHRLALVCQPGVIQKDGDFLKCRTCDRTFKRRHDYTIHLLKHREERAHKCETCGKTFLREHGLQDHINIHLGIRRYKCRFDDCDASYFSAASRAGHEMVKHLPPPKRCMCEKCGATFKFRKGLNLHKKQVHNPDYKYKCTYCPLTFKTRSTLNRHEFQHTNPRDKFCNVCGKAFYRLSELKMHIKRHNNEKTLFCKECGQGFYTNHRLKIHELRHTGAKPIHCPECDFKCTNNGSLQAHKQKNHPHLYVKTVRRIESLL